eukprot:3659991-Prymnesium_polylepis.1
MRDADATGAPVERTAKAADALLAAPDVRVAEVASALALLCFTFMPYAIVSRFMFMDFTKLSPKRRGKLQSVG